VRIDASRGTTRVAVKPFEVVDPVLKHNIIGEAKTGFLNNSSDILCEQPVGVILSDAFRAALGDAGLVVTDSGQVDYTLQGTIERLWVEEHATGHYPEYSKAYVQFDLLLSDSSGQSKWGHSVDIFKVSPDCFEATGQNIPTLLAALQQAIDECLSDDGFWQAMGLRTIGNAQ
jgi:hypothetical protein